VYGLLREHPVARRKARRFREKLLAFVVEDRLKRVHSAPFRNFDELRDYLRETSVAREEISKTSEVRFLLIL